MTESISDGQSPDSQGEKVRALQEAIAEVQASGGADPIVDSLLEERLAPLKAKAQRLVSHRDRSVHELRQRLSEVTTSEGDVVDPELVEIVVDRCIANGMVDDERFAHEWVRQRQHNQKKSVSALRRELRDKHVPSDIVEDALSQIDQDDQDEILRNLVTKKAGTVKTVPADLGEYDKALRRIVGVAARRGFPEGRSLAAARDALDERITELGG
ncbi:MAG TPA: recombination regulator RecX [Candidatus Corynebacterium avicola]|uniref:Regulatory protein RecX n=1 Tax=Candidatus Corynebacterium avicola TaxID=2838527 RepID=A0A9D1RR12_9CORY|nr:recombination regulator RecX [Candidatus Corynebacterium avicola]